MALKTRFERIARGEGARPLVFQQVDSGADTMRFLHVSPSLIQRDPNQPRKDLGELDGLRASIQDQGILQPLIVTPLDDKQYRLVAGERRLTAALQLGLAEVPVLVRGVEEHARLILQIVENLHRKDLSALEEAEGIQRLVDEFNLSQREAATRLGKSLTYINELLRVLQLPVDVIEAVRTSEQPISKSLLLEITKQPEEKVRWLWQRVSAGGGLTVQQARHHKRKAHLDPSKSATDSNSDKPAKIANTSDWILRTSVGTVIVRLDKGGTQDKKKVRVALEEASEAIGSTAKILRRCRGE